MGFFRGLRQNPRGLAVVGLLFLVAVLVAAIVYPLFWSGGGSSAGQSATPSGPATMSSSPAPMSASPSATPSPTATATPSPTPEPPASPVATVTVEPTEESTPVAIEATPEPTAQSCPGVFRPGDGIAAQGSTSFTPGGTGWLQFANAACGDAHCDALTVQFPGGQTVTDDTPEVIGTDLKWTFAIPADAGTGMASLSVKCTGDGTSSTATMQIPMAP